VGPKKKPIAYIELICVVEVGALCRTRRPARGQKSETFKETLHGGLPETEFKSLVNVIAREYLAEETDVMQAKDRGV